VNEAQLRSAFTEMAGQRVDAALVSDSGSFLAQRALIIELAAQYGLPMSYAFRDYTEQSDIVFIFSIRLEPTKTLQGSG
jgi:hypothetical protein